MPLVNEAIETTSRNSESAIERIEKRFKILREALNQREVELKEAVRHTTTQKIQSFRGQIQETESNVEMINAAVEKGEEAMDKDDLGYVDAYLHRLDDVLEKASTTFTAQELYATTDIPVSFGHPSLRSNISAHGTVGSIEVLTGGPRGHGVLLWDKSRTESKLEIFENGRSIKHVGPSAGKSTSISELGFGSGRNIWRMELQGLENGQWVSVGVCTAATMNTSWYSQDAVIFQAAIDDNDTNLTSSAAKKFQVKNNDVIMVVLDCEGTTVEYYKNKTCIKTAMLIVYEKPKKKTIAVSEKENTPRQRDIEGATKNDSNSVTEEKGEGSQKVQESSSDEATRKAEEKKENSSPHDDSYYDKFDENYDLVMEDTVWYPFGTLYQMGQVLRFQ